MRILRQKTERGFTLIEAVVATAVFAFIVSAIIGTYISTLELDRKTRAERAVEQNGDFIMQFLAKEIRNGAVDYPNFPGGVVPANPNTILFIENQANEHEEFSLSGSNLVLSKNSQSSNINSADVTVTTLKFFISPSQNPYSTTSAANGFNEQPHVTVVLGLQSTYGGGATNIANINLQSTFSTRTYPSRQ